MQVVALADAARGLPGDGLAQQGSGLAHGLEQGGLAGVHRLGRTGHTAVQVQRQAGEGRFGRDLAHGFRDPRRRLGVGDADIEADDGVVGDDVQGTAAADLRDIDGHALALAVQGVQAGGDHGRAGHGVGTLVEGPAGVGRLAGDDQVIVAAALARPCEGAVGQRRLIGHADMAARAQCRQQRRRGGRTDLLIGREQHGPADARAVRMGLERLQRREQDGDAALHVGDSGPVQRAVRTGHDRLERALRREDGVIVAGQNDLDRGVGAGGDLQGVGMGLGPYRAIITDRRRSLRRKAHDLGRQAARLGFQQGQHLGQTTGVTAA